MTSDAGLFGVGDWEVVKTVRNPWGHVPITDGGHALHGRARTYMDRLVSRQRDADPNKRRHHYVPRTYLRQWSFDGKRVWSLDTVTSEVKELGLRDICVAEDFYRVIGPDGDPHNRVELMFEVVDTELRRVQTLLNELQDPDELEFDDLIALGVTMAVQRMRTAQQRRLQLQLDAWLVAQNSDFAPINDPDNPYRASGIHTEMLFKGMWESADALTTRQIELWSDPQGRFMTCDAPVMVPFRRSRGFSLLTAPYVIWPISPHRVVALSNDLLGEKAVIREATGKHLGIVRDSVQQGRERMIFASAEQHDRLPKSKKFTQRTQWRFRCSQRNIDGNYIQRPGCGVEMVHVYASSPELFLCNNGLHSPAPELAAYR